MHTEFHRCMSGCAPLIAGNTASVRRTRLHVLVLLTLALAGESPTCILHDLVTCAIGVSHAVCKKLNFDTKNFLVDLTADAH